MTTTTRNLLVAVASLALATGPAMAQDRKADTAAKAHFQKAEKAFNLGKFEDALKGYEAAYDGKPLPGLLFNIAQCHRNLGNHERALFFYRRYLALDPATPNHALVEELIAEQELSADSKPRAGPAVAPLAAKAAPTTWPELPAAPNAKAATPGGATLAGTDNPSDQAETLPVYQRWWFWGAVGAIVVGTSAALLIRSEGSPPRGDLGAIDYR